MLKGSSVAAYTYSSVSLIGILSRGYCLNMISLQKSRDQPKNAKFQTLKCILRMCLYSYLLIVYSFSSLFYKFVILSLGFCQDLFCYIIYNMSQQQVQKVKKPKIVGDYIIGNTIGIGTHQKTNQRVSIKILNKNLIKQARDKINLSRQLRILKRVRHPNVAQLLQTFQTTNKIYIVMQYAEKGQLFNLITQNKKGRLSESASSVIFQQLINAVDYLHSIGVTHRDIKPQNILLDHMNNVKLIDFGLSNFYQSGQKLFTSCGSPCYASPEMLVDQSYDPYLADLWSCGIVLYAMICGFLPFQDKNTKTLYNKIRQGVYEKPLHMSIIAKDLISKILKFNPQQRMKTQSIRRHPFCNPTQPIVRGLMPSQTMKLDDEIIKQMNQLGYVSFKTDIQNHRNSPNTVAYYLLLYKKLKEKNQSLIEYYLNRFKDQQIKSPYRSKSLILKKSIEQTQKSGRIRKKSNLLQNQQQQQFLDKLYSKNKKKIFSIRKIKLQM